MAQATKPAAKTKTNEPIAPTVPAVPQGSGLPKVAGLDGSSPASNMGANMMPTMETEKPAENPPAATQPAMPMPTEPTPAPTTPAPESTTPPTEPTPEPTPMPAADPVLTDGEKSKWSKGMKELLKTLGNQDFATAKKQLTELESLARTQMQKDQHKRITTVARLTEEYYGFLIDAINGMEPFDSFDIGSTKASFIDGNETAISLKMRGKNQTFKLTELQVGVANALVDMKMDTAHPTSLARKAAFALVHPKTNDAALKRAREQMAEAAGAGAVEVDMNAVFDEDYSIMQASFQTSSEKLDVNKDGVVSPTDVLNLVNAMNSGVVAAGEGEYSSGVTETGRDGRLLNQNTLYDTNGDGVLSPLDVMLVVNRLQQSTQTSAVPEIEREKLGLDANDQALEELSLEDALSSRTQFRVTSLQSGASAVEFSPRLLKFSPRDTNCGLIPITQCRFGVFSWGTPIGTILASIVCK